MNRASVKLLRIVITLILCAGFNCAAASYNLASPDQKLQLAIEVAPDAVTYSLKLNEQPIITDAKAALKIKQQNTELKSEIVYQASNVNRKTVNQIIEPTVKQKSAFIPENYKQLSITLNDSQSIEFRLYNDGMAYRFSVQQEQDFVVDNEIARFSFYQDNRVLFPEEQSFISHNERLYLPTRLANIENQQFASLPLLVDVQGKQDRSIKVVITESGLKDYPGMWIQGTKSQWLQGIFPQHVKKSRLKENSDRNEDIIQRSAFLAIQRGSKQTRHYPWRIFAIATQDAQLLTNQLSYLLANESEVQDTSWIKPGKVAWDWWNANNIYGVDFKSGINTETYKYYIDFAAQYGIEYILLDEGWYALGDVLDVVPDIDVKGIIEYGKSKGVEVILWVIWETLDQQLENALDQFQQWGAAGIKVDFMQRDDQAMVNYYWRVAKAAAERQLLVNFHGSYKPAGLRRAYPNVLTREGVRGLEHNKWGDYITTEHNLTLPFIRMLAGPMDYTPGAMINAQPENFSIVFDRPMSQTTRVHQMSMFVIYESPMQMMADSPSHYLDNPESTKFIAAIPTVWDETRILSATLGEEIVMARRSKNQWFLAAMGNSKAREITLNLNFLGTQKYAMQSFQDGINADKYASDYKVVNSLVSGATQLTINLNKNGGWVAQLKPINE